VLRGFVVWIFGYGRLLLARDARNAKGINYPCPFALEGEIGVV